MAKSWTYNVDFEVLQNRVEAVEHSRRVAFQRDVAASLGVSYSTLRGELARRFGKSKQLDREAEIPDRLIDYLAQVKESYKQVTLKGDGRELATDDARQLMTREGVPGGGDYSTSTYNHGLRRLGYRTPRRRRRVEADYACQQFQMDFSRSKHFQIVGRTDDDTDWLLRVTAKGLHYKDGAVKLRTWVVQIVDEYSRLRLLRYYAATAESGILGVRFLNWVWSRPEDDHLMRHLPDRLKTDQGSFRKSRQGRSLLKALRIEPVSTEPGHSESQGKIESLFRTLWQQFESVLATQLMREQGTKATITLSRLCQMAHQYTIQEHARRHPVRRSRTRGALYQQSVLRHPAGAPRTVDADLLRLTARTYERKADATRLISIENVPYEVPAFAAGQWVRVHMNADGELRGELVDGYRAGEPFVVKLYQFAGLDDFSGRAHTYQQRMAAEARRELERIGEDSKRAQETLEEAAGDSAKPRPLMPTGNPVTPDSPFTHAEGERIEARTDTLTAFEAKARIGRALRQAGISLAHLDFTPFIRDVMTSEEADEAAREVVAAATGAARTRRAM